MAVTSVVLGATTLVLAGWGWSKIRLSQRIDYIRSYTYPVGLYEKLRKKRPELSQKDFQLVCQALRHFFLAYLRGGFRNVSMPSQVVDDLWHELILYTRGYELFCKRAFGRFLHHTPAAVLGSQRNSNVGLRRVWWHCCAEENINPRKPSRLPLLFAIDAKLKIADGFHYATDCRGLAARQRQDGGAVIYCGGDFDSPDFDGSTDGFGDSGAGDASSADSSAGSDAGCGGGGCGGGH